MADTGGPHSDDDLIQLGRMVVNFSALEVRCAALLADHGQTQQRGLVMVAGMNVSAMVERLRALTHRFTPEPPRDELLAWLDAVDKVRERRNRVVHSWWSTNDETGEVHLGKLARSPKGEMLTLAAPENLKQLADDIRSVVDGFGIVAMKLQQHGLTFMVPPPS